MPREGKGEEQKMALLGFPLASENTELEVQHQIFVQGSPF